MPVVLFDGEQWAQLGIADAVEAARLPIDLVMIDSLERAQRARDLPDPARAATLVKAALASYSSNTGRAHDPKRTIVAGQSFGGLAAAAVATFRPDLTRTAIVQSGSFWHRFGSPMVRGSAEPGELTNAVRTGGMRAPGTVMALQAGTDEGAMVELARSFADAASAGGAAVDLRIVRGGHDYAWWKHHLLRELQQQCARLLTVSD